MTGLREEVVPCCGVHDVRGVISPVTICLPNCLMLLFMGAFFHAQNADLMDF